MSQGQPVKSNILDASGNRAVVPITSAWRSPGGQSPYFGWFGQDGFSTIKIDRVQAIFPQMKQTGQFTPAEPTGLYVVVLDGMNMLINDQDALRLMKRMGWIEPGTLKN